MKINELKFPAGEYVGVTQNYVKLEIDQFSSRLSETKYTISTNHDLIREKGGTKRILTWQGSKWEWRPEGSEMRYEATPTLYGSLLVIEYLIYERGSKLVGWRHYLVKT